MHALLKPSAETLARVVPAGTPGAVEMTEAEFEAWVAQELANGWAPATPPPPVPYEVSRRQFFLAVHRAFNITRAQLRSMMPNEAALIDFDEAAQFKRDYPMLVALAATMQPPVTDAQLDDLFRLAATFE